MSGLVRADGYGWIAVNDIGDDGAKAMAEALKVNGSLTSLILRSAPLPRTWRGLRLPPRAQRLAWDA